tara:strand:+ start:1445 stop:1774 length:330 start_codon:yes stop_codon:yes gene_type:complete
MEIATVRNGIDIYFENLARAEQTAIERTRIDTLIAVRHDVERLDRNTGELQAELWRAFDAVAALNLPDPCVEFEKRSAKLIQQLIEPDIAWVLGALDAAEEAFTTDEGN